jgi:hypothetical protein
LLNLILVSFLVVREKFPEPPSCPREIPRPRPRSRPRGIPRPRPRPRVLIFPVPGNSPSPTFGPRPRPRNFKFPVPVTALVTIILANCDHRDELIADEHFESIYR